MGRLVRTAGIAEADDLASQHVFERRLAVHDLGSGLRVSQGREPAVIQGVAADLEVLAELTHARVVQPVSRLELDIARGDVEGAGQPSGVQSGGELVVQHVAVVPAGRHVHGAAGAFTRMPAIVDRLAENRLDVYDALPSPTRPR